MEEEITSCTICKLPHHDRELVMMYESTKGGMIWVCPPCHTKIIKEKIKAMEEAE